MIEFDEIVDILYIVCKTLIIVLALFIIILLILALVLGTDKSTYEYVDLNDEIGIAKQCYCAYGNLTCEKADKTIIKVKQFKEIKEEVKQ